MLVAKLSQDLNITLALSPAHHQELLEKKVGGDKKPKTPIDRSIRVLHMQSIKKN
jgi:hypothetical protein